MAFGRTSQRQVNPPQSTSTHFSAYNSDQNNNYNNYPQPRISQPQHRQHLSEIEFDSDANLAGPLADNTHTHHNTNRTNEELNLSVLRRRYPAVLNVLSIAAYAVIYTFSTASQTWEKAGIEGTLFVCRLATSSSPSEDGDIYDEDEEQEQEECYAVIILNRRGLENFELELKREEDVEVTDEYIILQGNGDMGAAAVDGTSNVDGAPVIYGLWIFAEPPPSSTAETRVINAKVIQDCAARAEASQLAAEERRAVRAQRMAEQLQSASEDAGGAGMARQLSLRELFGQQREQDNLFKGHQRMQDGSNLMPSETAAYSAQPSDDVLGDLFRRARQEYSSNR